MNEFSKETISINGTDYTLFLNRKGIVAWEKYNKEIKEELEAKSSKYQGYVDGTTEINLSDDANPFDGLDSIDEIDNDRKLLTKVYKRLYWIMLYSEHKLLVSKAEELYDLACEEYGEEQVIDLAVQMIEEANIEKNKNLKNLKALKPKKK